MILKMEKSETQTNVSLDEKKPEFSLMSIIIAFLLGIALIVFLQFMVNDITKSLYGEPPKTPDFYKGYNYQGVYYGNYQDAKTAFQKSELLPYETKALLVSTFINVPLFILSLVLVLSLGKLKPSFKLTTNTFFAAMVINILTLLGKLAEFIYKINQRLAIYGICLFLIIVFIGSIVYIQEKIRIRPTSPTS